MTTRRDFIKGIVAAAVILGIPSIDFENIVIAAEEYGIPIFWVTPEEYRKYKRVLKPENRFVDIKLISRGIDHVLYKGFPVIPTTSQIDRKEMLSGMKYEDLHRRFNYIIGG